MLLQRLREFSERLKLPPAMYLSTPIRWLLHLDAEGRLINCISMPGEGRNARGIAHLAPHVGRTVAVQAKLLADTAEYVLGIARDPEKQERVDRCHTAFVALVRDCAERTGEPAVRAVLRFLEGFDRALWTPPAGFEAGHILTFRVESDWPIQLPSVQAYWAAVAGGGDAAQGAATAATACLVCGKVRPPAGNVPVKIKRIPGGQTSGMALVSTNAVAFASYGLDDISGAPICLDCGERFSKAANALIEGEDSHITIGPLVYIFWTREEAGLRLGKAISRPTPDEIRALFAAAWKADPASAESPDSNRFYAAAFSASGARVVVRDWLDTTVPNAKRNLARYFAMQELVKPDGSESAPIWLYALAASTVRDANKDLPANVPRAILRLALYGGTLPDWLLYQAVNRNRVEQKVTRPRAALIKMALLSREESTFPFTKEHRMAQHDPEDPILTDPQKRRAYYCGCLLAVLERTQKAALGKTNTTIVGRFFGTASSAPASVFGRLMRMNQAHLEKLRKEKPGAYEALHQSIQDITCPHIPAFPRTLTLEEQGLFSLGYYHQHAKDRGKAIARKQTKDAKKKSK
jgi:CRISPR-associated protein Csd1